MVFRTFCKLVLQVDGQSIAHFLHSNNDHKTGVYGLE